MDPNQLFRDAVMLRTYCREVDGVLETPDQVYDRVIGAFKQYYARQIAAVPWFAENPGWERDWFERMRSGKALPAGRMLWSMGSSTVEKEGFLPLMNCAFVPFDHPVRPLKFLAKMLMLGCGVGFSLEWRFISKLLVKFSEMRGPITRLSMIVRVNVWDDGTYPANTHVVEDSREGWIKFLVYVMKRAIRYQSVYYTLDKLRPAGSPIKGFGGKTGDPAKLGEIAERIYWMLFELEDDYIETYYDVACSLGELIVSGNVRRSALIAVGDPDSTTFLGLKKFKNYTTKPWRSYCNNSVNVHRFDQLDDDYWNTFRGESEPYGFVNVDKCKFMDRCTERMYDKKYVPPEGFNPCAEQPLAAYEVCCLGEVNIVSNEDEEDLYQSLLMCYFFCKFAYSLGCPTELRTDHVTRVNQRIGISLSGIAVVPLERIRRAANTMSRIHDMDQAVSDWTFVNRSVALATVKPGGTLSKVSGSSGAGIHRPFSRYQIRRVRFPANSKMLGWLKDAGVPTEPAVHDASTTVVSFYLKNTEPADGHYADWVATDEGFVDTLKLITYVQMIWSDNAVSCTVYYDYAKLDSLVRPTLQRYFQKLKCFSGLPYYGHGFAQAPEEPISEEAYAKAVAGLKPYTHYGETDECDESLVDFGLCGPNGACSDR